MSGDECALQRAGGRDSNLAAADADGHQSAKLQELEPDGSGDCLRQLGSLQGYSAQGCDERVSERGEPRLSWLARRLAAEVRSANRCVDGSPVARVF